MAINDKLIQYTGKILFEPINLTKKHNNQAEWKRTAMVVLEGDICEYYQWFLKKRFNLILNKPLRSAHVTFINDNFYRDTKFELSNDDKEKLWTEVKSKWDGKTIEIILNVDYHTNGEHVWQIIPHEYRLGLQEIRNELGLDKPWAGMHMTVGYVTERNSEQLKYIRTLYKKNLIELHEEKYNKN